MNLFGKDHIRKFRMLCVVGILALTMAACGKNGGSGDDIIIIENKEERVVDLFSPMEKQKRMWKMLREAQQIRQSCWQKRNLESRLDM